MPDRDRGFLWFAVGNHHDYANMSKHLADSIKQNNAINNVCVAADDHNHKILSNYKNIDFVVKIPPSSHNTGNNFEFEANALLLTPFTHTIKLESDMLIPSSIDHWWKLLCQHDMVFSYDCLDIYGKTVIDTYHRKLFVKNNLPNIYSGLTYFRRSIRAKKFFDTCSDIIAQWDQLREQVLINCFEERPSTDVMYAVSSKLLDPCDRQKIKYDFFKMIHFKNHLNNTAESEEMLEKFIFQKNHDKLYVNGKIITQPFHYHQKKFLEAVHD